MPSVAPQALPQSVALLTFVLQEHHLVILEDWLDFFDHPITELVVHVGAGPGISARLQHLCATRAIRLQNLGPTSARETTDEEQRLLAAQFEAVTADFGCVVRLDTLPFRTAETLWQEATMTALASMGASFITGSTLPFRADLPTEDPSLLLTRRLSNCFLLIRPDVWRELQQGIPGSAEKHGRFLVEGAAEDYVQAQGLWGLRLLNRPDLRIFHCQEWGPRLLVVRARFRAGYRIARYLKGYQDDPPKTASHNYLERRPPILKRIRIFIGYWRRRLFR
ncbi:hypothetical protein [Falsigemmobacter faecalis]|uniref:Glycosyl transferase n=1 Tax=Falsigemmobacter faecalis TaxID=2488730 RepID=A0A3P3D5X7_9RHOB|nr:hypothetical protein [Falsigemmobacter faecalis]RRH69780.1 hypothetical protein EG244_18080 [Falsigemmobacter faecalis]